MITFRPMQESEFPAYRDCFIADYACEIAANLGYTMEESRTRAAHDLASRLPQTVATPDNFLLCLENTHHEMVGYLWYKLYNKSSYVFIFDFFILQPFRSNGYGQASLQLLEAHLDGLGVEQVRLRVAFNNKRALYLYEKLGFNITGYNMMKPLKKREGVRGTF